MNLFYWLIIILLIDWLLNFNEKNVILNMVQTQNTKNADDTDQSIATNDLQGSQNYVVWAHCADLDVNCNIVKFITGFSLYYNLFHNILR